MIKLIKATFYNEKAFFAGEKEDPLRWSKYPAVKAASENMFSDDTTIVIVKRLLQSKRKLVYGNA